MIIPSKTDPYVSCFLISGVEQTCWARDSKSCRLRTHLLADKMVTLLLRASTNSHHQGGMNSDPVNAEKLLADFASFQPPKGVEQAPLHPLPIKFSELASTSAGPVAPFCPLSPSEPPAEGFPRKRRALVGSMPPATVKIRRGDADELDSSSRDVGERIFMTLFETVKRFIGHAIDHLVTVTGTYRGISHGNIVGGTLQTRITPL